jgi:hypothetical protein
MAEFKEQYNESVNQNTGSLKKIIKNDKLIKCNRMETQITYIRDEKKVTNNIKGMQTVKREYFAKLYFNKWKFWKKWITFPHTYNLQKLHQGM